MARRRQNSKPDGRFTMSVNGHRIDAQKFGKKWYFGCRSFPEIEKKFDGAAETAGAIDEFVRLALAGAFKFSITITEQGNA